MAPFAKELFPVNPETAGVTVVGGVFTGGVTEGLISPF